MDNMLHFERMDKSYYLKIKTSNESSLPIIPYMLFVGIWLHGELLSGNFSIHFWRQYMSLFTLIATIVIPIVDPIEKVPAVEITWGFFPPEEGCDKLLYNSTTFFELFTFLPNYFHNLIRYVKMLASKALNTYSLF